MHLAERRLPLGHLERGDAERPEVAARVVRGVGVLVAGDHLGRHPGYTFVFTDSSKRHWESPDQ